MAPSAALQRDCFIFDLDGTLLDTLPDLVILTNVVLREFGMPERTTEQVLSYVGNGAQALMYQAVPSRTARSLADEALARWKQLYPELGHAGTKPYEGIPQVLDQLRAQGVALGVLSNKFDAATREVIEHHFPGVFDVVHGEAEGFPRKPDPQGMLRTIAELGSVPGRTVYVGDSPGDMQAAYNAGTLAVAVDWGYRSVEDIQQVGCDALIGNPADLLGFVHAQGGS